jgi:hypothetical protein
MIYNNQGIWTLEGGDTPPVTAADALRKGDKVGDRDFLCCSIKDAGSCAVDVQINTVDKDDEDHWKTVASLNAATPTTNVFIPASGYIRPVFTAGATADAFVAK